MKITTGKGQVEYYFVGFPKGRNYSRGIGDTLHASKIKVSSCQLKKTINTECFPFHTHSHRVFFGRKGRDCERNVGNYEKNGNM